MNIETNIKDVIVSPPDSNGSKRSFGSDDSLEYSNDDRSIANSGKGKIIGELDKPKDNILPPKYPPNSGTGFDHPDTSMFTPQRKQSVNMERLPGPLNLFSPGLSPIGHANHSQYDHEELTKDRNEDKSRFEEDGVYATYDTNMRDSMDSLEMTSPHFTKESREKPDEAGPNYQFWRNKLFSNDTAINTVSGGEAIVTEKQSLLFSVPDSPHQHKSFIRSNSNSFDSDFNLTPRHSLVYPTTDALYERSAALSPKSADVSMDSDLHVTRQSLVYPTTTALYERSAHRSANTSIVSDAYVTRQALAHSAVELFHERSVHGRQGQQSADVSVDSDAHVVHQSLVYPTTAALYERTAQRSTNTSVDSELHATKQSLIYPSPAALRYQSAGRQSADDSTESDISLVQQSYLCQPEVRSVERDNVGLDVSKLSMLDTGDSYYEEDALGQSLHSISLLPGSPTSSSPAPKQHASRLMFLPPRPNVISPSNVRNVVGERPAAKHTPPSSSSGPQQARRPGQQVSNSDTEYANSASKRRTAEQQARQSGYVWKEAEDVAPSGVFSTVPTLTTSMKSSEANTPRDDRSEFNLEEEEEEEEEEEDDDDLSVSPPAPPSPSSVSAGSPSTGPARQHHHQHHNNHHQYHATGAFPSSSLVVGGLYTLQVDSQGRPAFVPVLLDQHATAAAGVTFTSPNAAGEVLARNTMTTGDHGHHRTAAPLHQYASPPHRKSSTHLFPPVSARTDEFDLSGPNSNHVDVERVLDRALHRGSLSEEKVNKRWGGDTTKRNSPPAATASTTSHPHHAHLPMHMTDRGLPPVTPQRDAHRAYSSAGHSGLGPSAKSPFRLSVGADGKEHLQLSTEYYKERLLLRGLTSVLNTPTP